MAKTVAVKKPSASVETAHATAESYVVTSGGDLVVLDVTNAVVATYPRGMWSTARSGSA